MIDFSSFARWAEERFPGQTVVRGDEVHINSIFTDDHKFKLRCSPKGGKKLREDGCYRCLKTDKKGTLLGLVMLVDNCSYSEAKDAISYGGTPLHELEHYLEEMFTQVEAKPTAKSIALPPETYLINDLPGINKNRQKAENYLKNRKLSTDNLYICVSGKYYNRIIIPYYDKTGNLVYFNARNIGKSEIRYLNPGKDIGIGKGDVVFTPRWPKPGSKIYVTEGEFDALSLFICGFNAAACGGKYMTDTHVKLLRDYHICLAFDADSSGLQAVIDVGTRLLSLGIKNITYARPPQQVKDWNELLCEYNENIVKHYIATYEKPYDEWTGSNLLFNRL